MDRLSFKRLSKIIKTFFFFVPFFAPTSTDTAPMQRRARARSFRSYSLSVNYLLSEHETSRGWRENRGDAVYLGYNGHKREFFVQTSRNRRKMEQSRTMQHGESQVIAGIVHRRAVNPSRRSVCKSLIASSGPLGIIRWVGR